MFHFPNPVNERAARTVALILVAATLESVFAVGAGCWIYGRLMRLGVIPEATCEACNNVAARVGMAHAGSGTLTG